MEAKDTKKDMGVGQTRKVKVYEKVFKIKVGFNAKGKEGNNCDHSIERARDLLLSRGRRELLGLFENAFAILGFTRVPEVDCV